MLSPTSNSIHLFLHAWQRRAFSHAQSATSIGEMSPTHNANASANAIKVSDQLSQSLFRAGRMDDALHDM
jgi:hypothetical protein